MQLEVIMEWEFDDTDVSPENFAWQLSGKDLCIAGGSYEHSVRVYDDSNLGAIVHAPTRLANTPEVRSLVDFIVSSFDCSKISFYCEETGNYREIDQRLLQFFAKENCDAEPDASPNGGGAAEDESETTDNSPSVS